MEQHELTDEQIEWGKNNPLPISQLSMMQIAMLTAVGAENRHIFDIKGMMAWMEDERETLTARLIYRIKPDYQRPDAPPELIGNSFLKIAIQDDQWWVVEQELRGDEFNLHPAMAGTCFCSSPQQNDGFGVFYVGGSTDKRDGLKVKATPVQLEGLRDSMAKLMANLEGMKEPVEPTPKAYECNGCKWHITENASMYPRCSGCTCNPLLTYRWKGE